jgi:large subunit ribosomal protein L15
MIKLNSLPKTVIQKKKRIGLGEGSRHGKNAGKGHKGQTKHGGKRPIYFTGDNSDAGFSVLARTPKQKGFKARVDKQKVTLGLASIVKNFEGKEVVNLSLLIEKGLVSSKIKSVKIFNNLREAEFKSKFSFDEKDNIYLTKGVKELLK